jgi:[ribosomal protein S5]-alanine N-acetyltransferase
VLETERLRLRRLTADDAEFVVRLLNEPSFVRWIGDKNVRTTEEARRYIAEGPEATFARHGFGLLLVEARDTSEALGICGLLKREALPDPDLGFAFLPQYWSRGYARESASAVLVDARDRLGLTRILAITSPDNETSIRVLGKLGFRFERMTRLSEGEPGIRLFVRDA